MILLSHKNDFLISKVYIQQGLKKQRAAVSSEFLQLDFGFLFFFYDFCFLNSAFKLPFFTTPKPIPTGPLSDIPTMYDLEIFVDISVVGDHWLQRSQSEERKCLEDWHFLP